MTIVGFRLSARPKIRELNIVFINVSFLPLAEKIPFCRKPPLKDRYVLENLWISN